MTLTAQLKQKRGAPKGNQNALKHGYYCKVFLDEAKHRPLIKPCKRCIGGQVIANQCLNCGAEHTPDGEQITPQVTREDPRYERHFHWNKRALKG